MTRREKAAKDAPMKEAQAIADRANLVIVAKRTGAGNVRCWVVLRKTLPNATKVGERCNERAVLELVKRAAGSLATS